VFFCFILFMDITCEMASGEQRRGAAKFLTRTGVEHGECSQLRIRRLSRKCRKCYVCKYVDH
jgi:hypothetical protein